MPAEWKPNQPAAEQVPKLRFRLGLSFRALGHDVTPATAAAPAAPREGVSAEDSKPAGWAPPWSRPSRPPPRPPGSLDTPRALLIAEGCCAEAAGRSSSSSAALRSISQRGVRPRAADAMVGQWRPRSAATRETQLGG